jgi:hypothetical protein
VRLSYIYIYRSTTIPPLAFLNVRQSKLMTVVGLAFAGCGVGELDEVAAEAAREAAIRQRFRSMAHCAHPLSSAFGALLSSTKDDASRMTHPRHAS